MNKLGFGFMRMPLTKIVMEDENYMLWQIASLTNPRRTGFWAEDKWGGSQ